MSEQIHLLGRLTVRAEIRTVTGLAIGGGDTGMGLGGADSVVMRDPSTGEPYVPGSSLKGKLRFLLERALGAPLVPVGGGPARREARLIHRCLEEKDYHAAKLLEGYEGCPICHLFGSIADRFQVYPTRLLTRDAPLTEASRASLLKKRSELPFTEVKSEVILDRLTAAATPRQKERVLAGAAFDARWDLGLYAVDGKDLGDEKLLAVLFAGLGILESDYLGGQGSRGYGRVEIADLKVSVAHDGGLSEDARALAAAVASPGTVAKALEATGNPLAKGPG
jgi:CRISPR-associated protein Csm3